MINNYKVYLVWTTTLDFERIAESELFSVQVGNSTYAVVKESDLEKIKVDEEFSIPIVYGFEWTRFGNKDLKGKLLKVLPHCIVGSIEKS